MKIEKIIKIGDENYHYTSGYYSQNKWIDNDTVVLARATDEKIGNNENGKFLFEEADRGEPIAVKYVEGLIDALARGIYNLSISFNPDRVIIGGGISVREDLIQRLYERTSFYLERQRAQDLKLDIQVCEFHNDANLIGAVAHFKETVDTKSSVIQ